MKQEHLEDAAQAKATGMTRCVVCGNKWRYCSCGGQTPYDCDACQRGKGKGPKVGRNKNQQPVYADKLCPKHATIGVPCRNRAERRQAERQARAR